MKHIMVFFMLVLAGCGAFPPAGRQKGLAPDLFITALWNLQTLFDGREDGAEYADFREAAGWTPEKYAARITALSQAISRMLGDEKAARAPCLIGFTEVENAAVLEELAASPALSKQGYYWTAFANLPGAALGIGFLSRFPLTDLRAHSITIGKDTPPRPVLEIRIEGGGLPDNQPLVFLLNHWKSKLGGEDATEPLRRASARVVQRRLREIKESEADTPVIVMGDLNVNFDEYYRRSVGRRSTGAAGNSVPVLYALLPDDPDAASLAARHAVPDFLVLSAEKPPRVQYFPQTVTALYSPWHEELSGGSFYYKDAWESIDHFLLCEGLFDGVGWEFLSVELLDSVPFTRQDGTPNRYNPRSGMGLSDHLPLLLYLKAF